MVEKEIAMPPLPEETVEVETTVEPLIEETVEQQEPTESEPASEEAVVESPQQMNFKALRIEKERLERERNDAYKKLLEYENAGKEVKPDREVTEEVEVDLADDDLFEGRHYKKIQRQLKKQQETIDRYQQQANLTTTESKLKNKYTDFDAVVNEENIKRLRESEPELASSIASTTDIYSKAVSAYKMIKKLGIHVEDNFGSEREIAKKNNLKPKPLASVSPQQGESPLSKANAFANGLTPALRKQLWKEMEDSSKGY